MHTQPPLTPYEEVVYGVGPGLTPPTQPHYIPQYAPPVVVPQVTRPSIREWYPQLPYLCFMRSVQLIWVYEKNKQRSSHFEDYQCVSVCMFVYRLCPAPSRKKKRCCENNAKCYGGSGGVLLVLALLALAIWLGGILCLILINTIFICCSNLFMQSICILSPCGYINIQYTVYS